MEVKTTTTASAKQTDGLLITADVTSLVIYANVDASSLFEPESKNCEIRFLKVKSHQLNIEEKKLVVVGNNEPYEWLNANNEEVGKTKMIQVSGPKNPTYTLVCRLKQKHSIEWIDLYHYSSLRLESVVCLSLISLEVNVSFDGKFQLDCGANAKKQTQMMKEETINMSSIKLCGRSGALLSVVFPDCSQNRTKSFHMTAEGGSILTVGNVAADSCIAKSTRGSVLAWTAVHAANAEPTDLQLYADSGSLIQCKVPRLQKWTARAIEASHITIHAEYDGTGEGGDYTVASRGKVDLNLSRSPAPKGSENSFSSSSTSSSSDCTIM